MHWWQHDSTPQPLDCKSRALPVVPHTPLRHKKRMKYLLKIFLIHPSKWSFWYQMKAPTFCITLVKYTTDVDFKSYKQKCSESQKFAKINISWP